MYKTSLLSCTAAAAIILFNIQFTAHAETLGVTNEEKDISGKTYETIYVKDKGKITGSTVTVTGNESTNADTNNDKYVVTVEGANSALKLNGLNIQGTDSDVRFGISVKDGANINLTGGNITTSQTGVYIDGSDKNILQNVVISNNKNEISQLIGVQSDNGSNITLTNVNVTHAEVGILANNNSRINVSGGSFEGKMDGVYAMSGTTITVDGGTNVTSSNGNGLHAIDEKSEIIMTGGSVIGKDAALSADEGGHITVTGSTLTAKSNNPNTSTNDNKIESGFGALSQGKNSVVELSSTTINDATIGLKTQESGAIKMTGGSITASKVGAFFLGSKSKENKLKDVVISSGKDDAPLINGIKATNSNVTLNNVTVTQAQTAIDAYDSTVKVLGGSFNAEKAAIFTQNGGNITLTGDAKIISYNDAGLYAEGSKSIIEMTGGSITAQEEAVKTTSGGHITVTDVTLKTNGYGVGAASNDPGSMVELLGKTTINNAFIGLKVLDDGAIKMIGGTITASTAGAGFLNSNSRENKLENVTISGVKKDVPLFFGIKADKSTVTLKNVTVTQAATGVFEKGVLAENDSTITISGGSFHAQNTTISAQNGSAIILTNNANITSSDNVGLYAEGSKSTITMTGGTVTAANMAVFAKKGGHIDATDVALTTEGKGSGAFVSGNDSTIQLHGDTIINNTLSGLDAGNGGKIISENLSIIGGEALEGPDNERTGIWTSDSGSEVRLMGKTTIQNVDEGFYADGGSKIISGDLTITGGESKKQTVAVNVAELGSAIELNGKTIIQSFDVGLFAGNNSTIKMTNGYIGTAENTIKNKIEAKKVALWAAFNGHIDVVNTSMIAGVAGLQFIALSNPDLDYPDVPQKRKNSEINLTNADVHAENGTGIFVGAFTNTNMEDIPTLSIGTVSLKNSEIHADVLLGDGLFEDPKSWKNDNYWNNKEVKAISNGTFTLSADQSTLEGRANIAKDRNVRFDLKNNTKWTLKISKNEKDADGNLLDIAQRSRSDISTLNLDNSSIVFEKPTEDHYQTLHIGSGKPDTQEVYNATGDAKIYFNIAWSNGVVSADQKTDRLLIHGDVSGSTTVYIKSDSGNESSVVNAADPSNIGGLSLIQVAGKAQEDSFKLAKGYTTLGGEPYKYTLTAYGPDSSHGTADIEQNLFDEKNENFWDFRLHKEILETDSGPSVIVPVAQTASYLVMPNALFYSGLTDMAKQNAFLANIRTSVLGKEEEKQTGFFLYTYG
uniref:autotransporter outer membrane beta-barrel domain-containing protein n=1 Tax=Bartonella sp. AC70YNML TaxID=3243460 RepID=UPI0035CFB6DA